MAQANFENPEPSVSELVGELGDIKDWFKFGKAIKLPDETLQVIKKTKNRNYTHKMLSVYCRQGKPSWMNVVTSLKEVGDVTRAEKIEKQFCCLKEAGKDMHQVGVLQKDFAKIMDMCFCQLQENKASFEGVKSFTIGTFCPQELADGKFDLFADTEDVDDIFSILTKQGLWDYQNYKLLKMIIKHSLNNDQDLSGAISKYEEELSCYNDNTAVIAVDHRERGSSRIIPPLHLFEEFTIELQITFKEERIAYVTKLSAAVASKFTLDLAIVLLKKITNNPAAITWFIPNVFSKKVCDQFDQHKNWLIEEKVVHVQLGKEILLDKKASSSPEKIKGSKDQEVIKILNEAKTRFKKLTIRVQSVFHTAKVKYGMLKSYVESSTEGHIMMKDIFKMSNSIDAIFDALECFHFINYLNYHMLENSLKCVLDNSSPHFSLMDTEIKEYTQFLDTNVWSIALPDITRYSDDAFPQLPKQPEPQPQISACEVNRYLSKVTLELSAKEVDTLTMKYVDNISATFSAKLSIDRHVLLLRKVVLSKNGVTVTYDIPIGYANDICESKIYHSSIIKWREENLVTKIILDHNLPMFNGFRRRRLKDPHTSPLPFSVPLFLTKGWKCNTDFRVVKSDDRSSNFGSKLNIVPAALGLLRHINKPIGILGICGPYRSGKSYFVSHLLGLPQTFEIGHSTGACTHGIWMATHILECDQYAIVVLDMEGTGAVGKDEASNAAMNSLLVMTTLISSYLIYNSKNIPQKGNLDEMTYFAQLTSSILIGKEMDTAAPMYLSQHLPNFLWLLRDVTLELPEKENGVTMTPTEYLRIDVLNEGQETAHTLLRLFPTLRVSMLPPPAKNPQKSPTSECNKFFKLELNRIIEEILKSVKPKKAFNGALLTGPIIGDLIREYEKAINGPNAIPDIENSWYTVLGLHLTKFSGTLVKEYTTELQVCVEGKFPMEEGCLQDNFPDTLYGIHTAVFSKCERRLDNEIRRLLLPAGSYDQASLQLQEKHEQLHEEFRRKIIAFNDSMEMSSCELYKFVQKNFEKSRQYCQSRFDSNFSEMVDEVSIAKLTTQYTTLALGPAKEMVLNNEMEHIPGPPLDVTISVEDDNSKCSILSWNVPKVQPQAAIKYEIQMKEKKSHWKTPEFITETKITYDRSVAVFDLSPNTEYSFRIRGKNEKRVGEYCAIYTCTTEPGRPKQPPQLGFEQEEPWEAIITINPLQERGDNGSPIQKVKVQCVFVCGSTSFPLEEEEITIESKLPMQHKIKMKSYDKRGYYQYQVMFKNAVGCSEPSEPYKVHTFELLPGKPSNVVKECHVHSIVFKWDPPEYHPKSAESYEIKSREQGSSDDDWKPYRTTETKYTQYNLKAITEYEFEISTENRRLRGSTYRGLVCTNAGCPSQPNPPVVAVISSTKVSITVQKLNEENENGRPVTHIKIEKSADQKSWESDINDFVCRNQSFKMETELSIINSYNTCVSYFHYRVSMKNEKGWSISSQETQLEDSNLIPSAPTGLELVKQNCGPTKIHLKWGAPLYHQHVVSEYTVIIQSDCQQRQHIFRSHDQLSCIVDHLHPYTKYKIKVMSQTKDKKGEYCQEIEHCTPFAPPRAPSKTQFSVEVVSAKEAELHVHIPCVQRGEKKIEYIIVERSSDGANWEKDPETKVLCGEDVLMRFNAKYSKYMRMSFKNDIGISEASEGVNVPSGQFIPGEPINLEIEKKTASSVILCWNRPQANPNSVKRYGIERQDKDQGNWIRLHSVNGLKSDITELQPCTSYKFKVCAQNDVRSGSFCEPVCVTTSLLQPKYPEIKMLTCNSVTLRFSKSDLRGVKKICIETRKEDGNWTTHIKDYCDSETSCSYTTTLEFIGTPLEWRVKTMNGDLCSKYSEITRLGIACFIPEAPKVLNKEVHTEEIVVHWEKPEKRFQCIDVYEILVKSMSDQTWRKLRIDKNEHEVSIRDLTMATNYKIKIYAYNKNKIKGEITTLHLTTKCLIPGPPLNFRKAGASRNRIKMRWNLPSENAEAVTRYHILYKRSNEDESKYMKFKAESRVFSAVKWNLETGTRYDFKIYAENKDGESGSSTECKEVSTKSAMAKRVAIGAAIVIPTLGAGPAIVHHVMNSDDDVDESN